MSEVLPNTDRKTIAGQLANSDRPTVYWFESNFNPCVLNYLLTEREGRTARFYELLHVADATGLDAVIATRYVFREDGSMVGVFDSVVPTDQVDNDEVDYDGLVAMDDFQWESGLATPDQTDELKLDDLLSQAIDNPTLSEEPHIE